ncbi:MAG: M56 family metallopeptidase, partial [Planctomycetota bacterium]
MDAILEQINAAGNAFVDFALPMLVQSSLLIVVLLGLDMILRRRKRAIFRYWIWMIVLVKLILPTTLSLPTSPAYWLDDDLRDVTARRPMPPERFEIAIPIAETLAEAPTVPEATLTARSGESIPPDPGPAPPVKAVVATPPAMPASSVAWQGFVLLLWLAVVITMTLLLVQRAFLVKGLIAQSKDANAEMLDILERGRKQMKVHRSVSLRLSPVAASPSVCGLFRPTILIPRSLAEKLNSQHLKSIILHELAHVKRGDLWLSLLQTALQIIYFYNPLLWLANAMIRKVREAAVDETVLAAMGEQAEDYARTLLDVSRLTFSRPALSLRLIGVVESRKALAGRIRHMASRPFPRTARLGIAGLLGVIVMAAVLLPMARGQNNGATEGRYGGGDGTVDEPYLVYTAEQLDSIGVNPGDWQKHFRLMADIDLSVYQGNTFHLIGNDVQAFGGVFDGNGKTISNFTYIVTGNEEQSDETVIAGIGFFRNVNNYYAVIKDLGFIDPNIHPTPTCSKRVESVGALVGSFSTGLIDNCYVEGGSVRGERRVGGLVGISQGVISKCYTTCVVESAEPRLLDVQRRSEFIGGLVGWNYGEIANCHATGDVAGEAYIGGLVGRCYKIGAIADSWAGGDISGERQVGGLVGGNDVPLTNCYATGSATGQSHVGGLAGASDGSLSNCYATGSVSADNQQAGGLTGSNNGVMSECYATGSVVASYMAGGGLVGLNGGTIQRCYSRSQVSGGSNIGGLVGWNRKGTEDFLGTPLVYNGIIEDSYAQGSVSGVSDRYSIGGLIGGVDGGILSRCYAAGEVTGSGRVGGLVGYVGDSFPFEIEQCFWDIKASNQAYSAAGTGLNTEAMQDPNTFLAAGWDFTGETANGLADFWTMNINTDSCPQLAWSVEPEPFLVFEFNEDPNWTTQGQWQFGRPQGLGGAEHGHSDPNSGYTGGNVYGVNLAGDYDATDTNPHYLTAGPFDCSQYSWVKLQFARWLNSDEADYAKAFVQVSTNGANWHTVWQYDD